MKEGLIDKIIPGNNALEKTIEDAEKLAKYGENKPNFKKLKDEMYKDVVDSSYNKQHSVGVRGELDYQMHPKL